MTTIRADTNDVASSQVLRLAVAIATLSLLAVAGYATALGVGRRSDVHPLPAELLSPAFTASPKEVHP